MHKLHQMVWSSCTSDMQGSNSVQIKQFLLFDVNHALHKKPYFGRNQCL